MLDQKKLESSLFQIADQYAFIPREAISRFLLYCTECQRKQPPGGGGASKKTKLNNEQQLTIEVESLKTVPSPVYFDPKKPFLHQINPPATPPATPPIDPGSPPKVVLYGAGCRICQEEGGRCESLQHTKYLPQGIHNDLTTCGQDQRRQSKSPGEPNPHPDHYATPALAYAQAIQSFKTPTLPYPIYHHPPVKILPITAENLQKLENSSDIDLSLPITSTYLRRMRRQGDGDPPYGRQGDGDPPYGVGQDPPTISIGPVSTNNNQDKGNVNKSTDLYQIITI